ncbi:MAG: DNA photolyase family protein [Gammaproteobacteria bacterium]|nr:DNA photolyase family protein [Gammaproteobacteria bacterium]
MSDRIYRTSIFIFRRDLRLEDNRGLLRALEESERVVPLFIFDPRQIDAAKNGYFSHNSFQFMIESLEELDQALKNRGSQLQFGHGTAAEVLEDLLSSGRFQAVYFNADYTPFAKKRDRALKSVCDKKGVAFHTTHDALLARPQDVQTGDGQPYKVYTAFMKKARASTNVPKPRANNFSTFYTSRIGDLQGISLFDELMPVAERRKLAQRGGRSQALQRARSFEFSRYGDDRNRPDVDGTSKLSAHLKFGTVSVRELYRQVVDSVGEEKARTYTNELYWRDFYAHLLYWYPELLGNAMQEKYRTKSGGSTLEWSRSKTDFEKWCQGLTGFPIVDAGMRQLNATGWMHNRVRMIVGSFLTKDLHIDWRWGEKYFAQNLVDYDPASNNGGWQWVASTGADAQPYFRIFNPWSQQQKFDPDCQYIKRYVSELYDLSPAEIHAFEKHGVPEGVDYPDPIIDHKTEREITLVRYKRVR